MDDKPVAGVAGMRVTLEGMLEGTLVLIAAALFTLALVQARQWDEAALLPRIAGSLGLAVLIAHVIQRLLNRRRKLAGEKAPILDLGFDETDIATSDVVMRTARIFGAIAALFGGVWLVGFHITIPVFLFTYLSTYGKMRLWTSLLAAAIFEGLMIILFDVITDTIWNKPVLFSFFR